MTLFNSLVKPSRLNDWLERVPAENKASKKRSEKWFMDKYFFYILENTWLQLYYRLHLVMDEKICMKESPLCFLASKAKLAICIIAACLDLPVYMVLVSKRLLPWGHSVPRSFSIRGYCSQLFPNTPLRPASYRRNYTTPWVHRPQILNKSTQQRSDDVGTFYDLLEYLGSDPGLQEKPPS